MALENCAKLLTVTLSVVVVDTLTLFRRFATIV